ncbi:hypothetical protein BGX21_003935 [Mortierella sp. AD011]|nr:hypothetical protein BGX20_011196 [Mortierella sp. AD010]KAF9403459.1 hypothetical protein BGX21_003935 [Mortierella sp. AD011]
MKTLSITAAIGVVLSALQVVQADLSKIVRVDPSTQMFIDAEGRSRFFHGTNMVSKSPPWHLNVNTFVPGRSIVEKDIEFLKSINVNSIRLGVHWAGVEPVRGQYNQTFLDISNGIIQKFQDNGIYTLVDQHQDVFAEQLCGHGVPLWFVKPGWVTASHGFPVPQTSTPFPVDANGIPAESDCNSIDWATSYLSYAVGNAFGRLYNNYDNLGDSWAAYWNKVASSYGSLPGVMGYDLMNEPWVGDHMADPTLLVPGKADGVNMEPLWNKGNAAIRAVDNTTIVFFEGSTFDILNGFNNVPGGDGSKTAQSYHYYKPPQLSTIDVTIKNRITDATRLKTTGMLTEFQFWDSSPASLALIQQAVYEADNYLQSWQGWAYENLWNSDGTFDPLLARTYARTYAEATAGTTKTLYFQDVTGKYWVSWAADTSITAPGLIRIAPQYYYPDGIRVFFTPANAGTYTMDGTNTVQLHYTSQAQSGQTIQASVQPFFPTDVVKNGASGKCMDNSKSAVTPNNPILLWTCNSTANQIWKFKNGTISLAFDPNNKSDTFCLDTQPISGKTYQSAVLNSCNGSATQQWTVNSSGNIVNGATGNCLDITGANYSEGTVLISYPCGNPTQGNQVWTLPRGANGVW